MEELISCDSTIKVTEFLYALRLIIKASRRLTNEDMVILEKNAEKIEEIKE